MMMMKKKNLKKNHSSSSSSKLDISAPLSKTKSANGSSGIVRNVLVPVSIVGCFILVSMIVSSIVSIAFDDTLAKEMELLRKQEAAGGGTGTGAVLLSTHSKENNNKQQQQEAKDVDYLIIQTEYGDIRIKLRPDLSKESVQHIQQLAASNGNCKACQFYRSERDLLLQGVMKPTDDASAITRPPKGPCPLEFANQKQNCPPHDAQCACHGPTMTKGMVGWAGGGTGPDFFINVFKKPVDWWGQQHTVWGVVEDPNSLQTIESTIFTLPIQKAGIMNMLQQPIDFTMKLQEQSQ